MKNKARVIAVTSGKGGVGKTHITANLGILLAKQGKRTCIIDADHGLANINLILGIPATNQPIELFQSDFDPNQCVINTELGVDILPSASGISRNNALIAPDKEQIVQLVEKLRPNYDVILIDTAAGISHTIKNYLSVADHVLLIINSEPTSLTDGFGLIRKMKDVQPYYDIIINRVSNAAAATGIYKRFAGAVRKYIGAQLGAIGYISEDSFVSAAVLSQTALVNYSPSCLASQCLNRIARSLLRKINEEIVSDVSSASKNKVSQNEQNTTVTDKPVKSDRPVESNPINAEHQSVEIVSDKKPIETIPDSPSFIRAEKKAHPFEDWLTHLAPFLDKNNATEKSRVSRKRRLILELGRLCDGDDKLLADLEELVVVKSHAKSQKILQKGQSIEQSNIAARLAKTRFVEEPIFEPNAERKIRSNGVNRAFSIISKFK